MDKLFKINRKRLEKRINEIARFGATENGGVTRLALSHEDKLAREQMISWFRESGCEIDIDRIGNIFAIYPGKNRTLAPVLTGSHGDSQPCGGRFDGILGIIAGLEVVATLNDQKIILERDLIVANWTNEEGVRFVPCSTGVAVWTGKLNLHEMYQLNDKDGTTLEAALEETGFKGLTSGPDRDIHAAFEFHIEQGPVLDTKQITIGIPEGIACLRWFDVEINGVANHAGSTPMNLRSDALYCFSEIHSRIREIAIQNGGIVATVGKIDVMPSSRNVIPGRVCFTMDVRGWNLDLVDRGCADIEAAIQTIAGEHGSHAVCEEIYRENRTEFNKDLVSLVKKTAEDLQYPYLQMISGASHDMVYINEIAPGAMIFVPSIGGISHSEQEDTSPADYCAGTDVLLNCIIRAANDFESDPLC